ncbi:secretogranin-2 [Aquila chrysaetos chrysaetos]|uniref:Secretogranin II n=1 Tax=Aquila chrysaetos chrysaetos TaxID=223781 RepID=A0A663E5J8_AQUCH|nr:secretogranin-2 [Aquila chrysaetos chrysaetos]XP_029884992.1 secretogranin-2 [Aquila chrysaetos chrysaetos]XP_029884993.1 secretogranin-2 [Aquila chrysaetos chrysaetos]
MAETKTFQLGAACALTFFFVLICWVDAASFQQHQLLQKDPDYVMKNLQRFPNPDMIKALEYIEDLRKQTNKGESSPDYNSYQSVPYLLQQKESKDQVHLPDNVRDSLPEDESQWVKVMLEALRQAEKESKAGPKENKPFGLSSDNNFAAGVADDYEAYKWPERWQKYLKMPLGHYEDSSRDSPFKRTNEIVEEQYTPQSLATLESVFQELGKMAGPNNHKKERLDEDQKLYTDDEDDVYKVNNIAYEDVVGGEDWNPIEEKVESQTQEEIKDSKEEIDKHEEEIDDEMKRSGKLGLLEDEIRRDNKDQMSEDVSKLMNYYLKRLIGGAGNRKLRTGGELEEKRAPTFLDKQLDPQSIAQLIEISRNLQIPPEDLIDMLKAGEKKQLQSERLEAEQEVEFPEDLDEIIETNLGQSDIFKNNVNSKNGYMKQPLNIIPENLPEDLNIEDIVSLLGTDNLANQNPSYLLNRLNQENDLPRLSYIPRRLKGHPLPKAAWMNDLERRQMEYEKLNEKDEELADYLAKVLAKYPEVININQMKRVPLPASESDLQEDDQLEQAIREHLSRLGPQEAAKLASLSKRLSMAGETDDTQNRQYLDEDMLAKVLEYLKQEKSELERDHITKRAMENM